MGHMVGEEKYECMMESLWIRNLVISMESE